ncbi:DUF4352 domain-containing protein [Clostridium sardiniense]|uniref:DUF4352 domain-containing protein n=1 Tax=Clostridium sardiniense TaxID=29369 RepID=UPI003D35727F
MNNKKQIIIYVIIAIVFFTLGGSFGYNRGEANTYNKMRSSGEKTDNSEQNDTKKEDASNIKSIKLNQTEKFSGVEMKVLNSKEANSVNNESGNVKASGKFIIIEISLKNISKEAIEYSPKIFRLINNGIEYQSDDVAFDALQKLNSQKSIYDEDKNYIGPYDKFNPGITKKTFIAFDVPKDVDLKDVKLIIQDDKNVQFDLN